MEPVLWNQLFGSPGTTGSDGATLAMREVRRKGQPWLLLPSNPALAIKVLDLYVPQTTCGRLGRLGLRTFIRLGVPSGTSPIEIPVPPESKLLRFCSELTGQPGHSIPQFGGLAGNAATPGQRFILLIFNAAGQPAAIVKAGFTARARQLIKQEAAFLESAPPTLAGLPRCRSRCETDNLDAFAMDFVAGHPPTPRDADRMPPLLRAWVDTTRQISISETGAWRALGNAIGADPAFKNLSRNLEGHSIPQTVTHGDFASWNAKVQPDGSCVVLDWERGSLAGIPGWDWFHFVVQSAILVAHESPASVAERMMALIASPDFRSYADVTRIVGLEQELLCAYLLHYVHVLQPSEGLTAARELLAILSARARQ
jgi:hypothetical protein